MACRISLLCFISIVFSSLSYNGKYKGCTIYKYKLPPSYNLNLDYYKAYVFDPRSPVSSFGAEWLIDQLLNETTLLPHHCQITTNPNEADLFFVPYYVHLAEVEKIPLPQLHLMKQELFSDYLPFYQRLNGFDHLFLCTYAWDHFWWDQSREDPLIQHVIRIGPDLWYHQDDMRSYTSSINKFTNHRMDIVVPYSDFSFLSNSTSWLPDPFAYKPFFAMFIGSTHINHMVVRQRLRGAIDRFLSSNTSFPIYFEAPSYSRSKGIDLVQLKQKMEESIFCLCPKGDTDQTKRLYNALHCGCIPVIIADSISLPYSSILNWSSFSIHLPESSLICHLQNNIFHYPNWPYMNIFDYLASIPPSVIQQMRKTINSVRGHFVWHTDSIEVGDAMDLFLNEVKLRVINVRLWKESVRIHDHDKKHLIRGIKNY
jgi:probable glucuronoxylan glucuronosyltransferase IRX7